MSFTTTTAFRSLALTVRRAHNAPRIITTGLLRSGGQNAGARFFSAASIRPQQAAQQQTGPIVGAPAAKRIPVDLGGGKSAEFEAIFLRDSCRCPTCIDPSNQQKLFQTSDIPSDIQGRYTKAVNKEGRELVRISWTPDVPGYSPDHTTVIPVEWLRKSLEHEDQLAAGIEDPRSERVYWDRPTMERDNKWIDYNQYLKDDAVCFETLEQLWKYGLVFINGVPDVENAVEHIVHRIGVIRETFYGLTFDVKSVPNAKNIAYTHQFLGLHMDLCYMTNPPHLQLLHSLRAQSPGGESLFSDTFNTATYLRTHVPQHFQSLCTFPITYHYDNNNQHYSYTRPTIELAPPSKTRPASPPRLLRCNWSPPFQGPMSHDTGTRNPSALRAYIAAANAFEKHLSRDDNVFEYRLNEGECVIFDNRRVLHARRAFDNTVGERWLKGAYVDDDVFYSKLRVLGEKLGRGRERVYGS